jgi:tetratricopeptide (TPR) repeat protein
MIAPVRQASRSLLVVCFFVCPLLFFTNLTRNPYITQISLLNIAALLAGALLLWRTSDGAALPRTPVDRPLAAWVGVCALSWSVAYAFHKPWFRPSMAAEGARAFLFLLANALVPFYLAADLVRETGSADEDVPLGGWIGFVFLWGALWLAFRQLRGPGAAPTDIWAHVWDGYGFCLWAGGFAAVWALCRRGRWIDFLHLALATGFMAAVYGVLQYFNLEFIWPQTLNPYGGRAVSTFGNPNFLSSYCVVLLPAAVTLFSRASGGRRLAYGALALALEAALLCSLTRSSWLGAAAGLALLALSPDFRRAAAADPRPHGLLFGVGAAMAVLWPSSSIVSGYTPSVAGRISEVVSAVGSGQKYGSIWQRFLIWTCGWLMGAENPLTGKGFGLFELFYPFYQGPVLAAVEFWRPMRTHANNAHNEIVEVFAQTGLLGVGVFAWLWLAFARQAAARWLQRAAGGGALLMACAAGAFGMLVDNMLNVSMHFAVPAFVFWWAVGAACSAQQPKPAPAPQAAAPAPRAPVLVWGPRVAAVALVLLSWIWVRVWFRETHYFAGFKLAKHRQLPAAERVLERSRAWGPREVNAIYELGNVYAQSQQHAKAALTYKLALDANAGYDEIYYNLGAVEASHLGRLEQAIDHFRVSHWINPLSAEIYTSLGNLYLADAARHMNAALALLEQGVVLYPNNPAHWSNLGFLYAKSGRFADAERAYSRALVINPGFAQAQTNLEVLVRESGRPRPKLLDAVRDLRELEARAQKRDLSAATLALARKLDAELPDNPRVRFYLGSLLMALSRPAEAAAPLEWVVSREPGHSFARLNLGEAYLMQGRREDAAVQYRAVLGIEPGNALASRRLAELGTR